MVQVRNRRKIVKPLAKGQVTIPAEFRDALGIDTETLLSISLIGDHLEIRPLRQGEEELR
jgi:AbrB family looped-hinge helix DNA binding protein